MHWKNIIKMTILSKAIYRFNAIPIQISMALLTELEKIILKFMRKHKRSQLAKVILRNKNRGGSVTFPCFTMYILQGSSHQKGMVLAQKQTHS